jgi:hypothetical protein
LGDVVAGREFAVLGTMDRRMWRAGLSHPFHWMPSSNTWPHFAASSEHFLRDPASTLRNPVSTVQTSEHLA